jgi:hypothetical protein
MPRHRERHHAADFAATLYFAYAAPLRYAAMPPLRHAAIFAACGCRHAAITPPFSPPLSPFFDTLLSFRFLSDASRYAITPCCATCAG